MHSVWRPRDVEVVLSVIAMSSGEHTLSVIANEDTFQNDLMNTILKYLNLELISILCEPLTSSIFSLV